MGVWVAGAQPPASIKHKTYFVHRARRAGRRSRRARRAQASAGSASRAELGKGENRFEPSVSRIWQKQNVLAYVCDMLYICFSLYYLYLVCHRAPTHGGLGCRGAAPCVNQAQNLLCPPSAASGAAQPPRPQGASFRRKREPRGVGEGENSV